MSEEKFTKGEWALFEDRVGIIDRSDSQSYGIMNEIAYIDMYDHGKEQGIANAHLIAKAPEMYAMLKSVYSELAMLIDEVNDQRASRVTSTTEYEPDYHDQETLHLIQMLLAGARGEK